MLRPRSLLLVLAVLAATAAAFAETERLKVAPTAIERAYVQPQFSPVCNCADARAKIRLRFHRADDVTITILNAAARRVRMLVTARHVPSGRIEFAWDGRDDAGAVVPDGTYSVHVRLARAGTTIDLPKHIVVDTHAPTAQLVGYQPRVLTATTKPHIVVRYRVSEAAHAVLYVNGKRVARTYSKARTAKLEWFARIGGKPLRRGRYRLQLAGLDLAGNLGPRTPVFVIRVR